MQGVGVQRVVSCLERHADHREIVGHPPCRAACPGLLRDQHRHQRLPQALDARRSDPFVSQQQPGERLPGLWDESIGFPQGRRCLLGGPRFPLREREIAVRRLGRNPSRHHPAAPVRRYGRTSPASTILIEPAHRYSFSSSNL